jgi:HSF-type DNA-binding
MDTYKSYENAILSTLCVTGQSQYNNASQSSVSTRHTGDLQVSSVDEDTNMNLEAAHGTNLDFAGNDGNLVGVSTQRSHPEFELTLKVAGEAGGEAVRARRFGDFARKPILAVGGIASRAFSFPMVLHSLLEQAVGQEYDSIISWQSHGRAFIVHDQEHFVSDIMPHFFRQSQFPSFLRQLALYGFQRISKRTVSDQGSYFHEMFLRGEPDLCQNIQRQRIKGSSKQRSRREIPDFSLMTAVGTSIDECKQAAYTPIQTEQNLPNLEHEEAVNQLLYPPSGEPSFVITSETPHPILQQQLLLSKELSHSNIILPQGDNCEENNEIFIATESNITWQNGLVDMR